MPALLRTQTRAPCVTCVEKLAGRVTVLLRVPARSDRARFSVVFTVLTVAWVMPPNGLRLASD